MYAEALKSYLSAAGIDGEYAELEFRIARCLRALGDYTAARKHFLRARDLDTLRFRADSRINDINRSVASSSGAELVDADAIFANESLNGITGSDLVYEHVHLTPRGSYLLARAMFLQIASQLPFRDGASSPGGRRPFRGRMRAVAGIHPGMIIPGLWRKCCDACRSLPSPIN